MYNVNYKNPFKKNIRTQTTISFMEANLLSTYYSIVMCDYKDISKEKVKEMFLGACKEFNESREFVEMMEKQEKENRSYKSCVLNHCLFEMAYVDNIRKAKEIEITIT